MKKQRLLFLLFVPILVLSREPEEVAWTETVRTSFLRSLDKMLAYFSEEEGRSYVVDSAKKKRTFHADPYFQHFQQVYGYFSDEHPIVSKLTEDPEDFVIAQEALLKIFEKIQDPLQLEIMTCEVVTKVLAYRLLARGNVVKIPQVNAQGSIQLITYEVNEVLDLWRGMPAFGLIPQEPEGIPILLFRGTDLTFVTEKGWASMVSDLEVHDPGLATFQQGQNEIRAWLKKAAISREKPRLMGVSLGGILTMYTTLFEQNLINTKIPSIAFSPPGVSREILTEWNHLEKKPLLITYVCQGDAIPKYGRLMGKTELLFLDDVPAPINAHTQLATFHPEYYLQEIDIPRENASRKH